MSKTKKKPAKKAPLKPGIYKAKVVKATKSKLTFKVGKKEIVVKHAVPSKPKCRVGDKVEFDYDRVKVGNPVKGIVNAVTDKLLTVKLQKQVEGFSSTWKRGEVTILEWKHIKKFKIKKAFKVVRALKTKLEPEEYEKIKGSAEASLYIYNKKTKLWEQTLRTIKSLAEVRRRAPQFCLYTRVGNTDLFLKPDGGLTEDKKLAKTFFHGFDLPENRERYWGEKLGVNFKHRYNEQQDVPKQDNKGGRRKRKRVQTGIRDERVGDSVPVLAEVDIPHEPAYVPDGPFLP